MRRVLFLSLVLFLALGVVLAPARRAAAQSGSDPATATPPQVYGVETVTPAADGSIIHLVQPGQSAWSICLAYHISMADLIALNDLSDPPALLDGQKLIIRLAFTPTISPTVTKTPRPPTRTPTLTRTPRAPSATPTLAPTPTPTEFSLANVIPSLSAGNRRLFGIGMIVVCGLGLLLVLFVSFRKR